MLCLGDPGGSGGPSGSGGGPRGPCPTSARTAGAGSAPNSPRRRMACMKHRVEHTRGVASGIRRNGKADACMHTQVLMHTITTSARDHSSTCMGSQQYLHGITAVLAWDHSSTCKGSQQYLQGITAVLARDHSGGRVVCTDMAWSFRTCWSYPVLVREPHERVHSQPRSRLLPREPLLTGRAHDLGGVDKVVVVKSTCLALFWLVAQRAVVPVRGGDMTCDTM